MHVSVRHVLEEPHLPFSQLCSPGASPAVLSVSTVFTHNSQCTNSKMGSLGIPTGRRGFTH